MFFKNFGDLLKLIVGLGKFFFHLPNVFGQANPRHHILALGVGQVVPLDLRFAGGAISGHGHAGGAVISHISKNHGDNADRGSQIMGDPGGVPIINGPFPVPAPKDRFRAEPQLIIRIIRERKAGAALKNFFKLIGHFPPVFGQKLGIGLHAFFCPDLCDDIFKIIVIHSHDHASKHLNESAVRVVNKPGISSQLNHAPNRLVIESDVQNRVHHAGHGKFSPGPA